MEKHVRQALFIKDIHKVFSYLKLARLHRPYAIWILMFPAWWGLVLTSPTLPSFDLFSLFALGAILVRSAGCIYNDIIDKKFDVHVKRTAMRPLGRGEISLWGAWIFLVFLLGGAAWILFTLPSQVILTGFIALGLIGAYPWMKRLTYWPQIFLGVTYNMGLIMGELTFAPSLSLPLILFYGGAILWTLGYDTIYALQDREDDLQIGIKSSAIVVFPFLTPFLIAVYGGALLFWGVAAELLHFGAIYWVSWILVALHFSWQIFSLKKQDATNCLTRFNANSLVGLLLFLGLVFSRFIN